MAEDVPPHSQSQQQPEESTAAPVETAASAVVVAIADDEEGIIAHGGHDGDGNDGEREKVGRKKEKKFKLILMYNAASLYKCRSPRPSRFRQSDRSRRSLMSKFAQKMLWEEIVLRIWEFLCQKKVSSEFRIMYSFRLLTGITKPFSWLSRNLPFSEAWTRSWEMGTRFVLWSRLFCKRTENRGAFYWYCNWIKVRDEITHIHTHTLQLQLSVYFIVWGKKQFPTLRNITVEAHCSHLCF